jgi:hypothetical protein
MNEASQPNAGQVADLQQLQAVKTQLEIDQLRAPWFRRHANQTAMLTIFSAIILGVLGLFGGLGGMYFNSERVKLATEVAKSESFTSTIKRISDAGGVAMIGTTDGQLSYMVTFEPGAAELFRDMDAALWSDERLLRSRERKNIDSLLEDIHHLPNVTVVTISTDDWEVTHSGIDHLTRLNNLQAIALYGHDVDDDVLRSISRIKSLKFLAVSSNNVTSAGIAHIKALRHLEQLAIDGVNVSDGALTNLRGLSQLQTIELAGFGWSKEAIRELSEIRSLEHVYITFAIGDAELAHLAQLPDLKTLSIEDAASITDDGLASLGRMRALSDLELMQAKSISDRGIGFITDCRQLRRLSILGSSFTDVAVCRIPVLSNLVSLRLDGKTITGHGLVQLSSMKQLERLRLDATAITDDAIPALVGLRNLKVLELHDSGVSDSAVDVLARLSQIQIVHMGHSKMTREGFVKLAKLRPEVVIADY